MRTIVWDVDDVLNSLMRDWLEQEWRPAHPECTRGYPEISTNPPLEALGITAVEYLDSLDRFRLSDKARDMEPNPQTLEWFRCHGTRYRHIALTARPLATAPAAAEWALRRFGAYIRVFAVTPCRSLPGEPFYDAGKPEFLQWWSKGDILVDDSVENIEAAARLGIRGALFPQPWNGAALTQREALLRLAEIAAGLK